MTEAHEIAAELGEAKPQPIALIGRILRRLGHAETWALVERVREIEAAGGMPTSDGARQRTPGGVFFALVKQHLEESGQKEAAEALFPAQRKQQRRGHPAHPAHQPPLHIGLRPRVKGRPGAPPPRSLPGAPPSPPVIVLLDSNSALAAARRLLTAEMGCYAVGAHQATSTLRVRFSFPEVARARYADQIAALERESGWRVELHAEPHQGHLADAARRTLPAAITPVGPPSLRPATRTVLLRCRGTASEEELAVAQRVFQGETGWRLDLEQLAP
jgi:hypothetical protein